MEPDPKYGYPSGVVALWETYEAISLGWMKSPEKG
jgi:hypothetical protein